ncbi:HNH endonuclease signature motif containing protein [Arthrobacter sp. FW306-2-2C-D06B]|uniref:HNH endonuclease signature motif containing protein n=1 Tax=Arthrobacter sp. FW306-2-2C-D06B TaxID=2879618 RepID=UPI001F402A59|nr:HNH endonuclease signature motif containing protein [Arthrobacter sp. FW306-2-2C-D06B]UKA56918.1 HNH endonuclease [Arthrobacter sp. FW306-2-2C-D06B]
MEAIGYFDTRQGLASRGLSGVSRHTRVPHLAGVPGGLALVELRGRGGRQGALDRAVAALRSLAEKAADDVGVLGLEEAVAFASGVEELSRTLDYLQLLAAAGLDQARNDEPGTRPGWTTGWATGRAADADTGADKGSGTGWTSGISAAEADAQDGATVQGGSPGSVQAGSARGGEFRSTAEHLRSLLRISAAEARRRLALARELLPRRGLTGETVPARHGETAAALASGVIGSGAAGIITMAVAKVRPLCAPEKAAEMEHTLARTAAENDQDFLARVARRWVEAIDQDGPEPSEESLRHHQGAFLRRPKHGLAHVEIFATAEQYEHLLTVMNTAANPRTRQGGVLRGAVPACVEPSGGFFGDSSADSSGDSSADLSADSSGEAPENAGPLDRRSRAQKLLDGLVGACRLALATGSLPATGGHRPQILATIDHRDLFPQDSQDPQPGQPALFNRPRQGSGTGSFTFTGPVPAATLRKLACDADIIPVVLGTEGQVLDIGRASRIFPPHIRKAITARDKGCAFPGCTMPAPWCEAHHIEYWSRGGPTSAANGTLLCSHHHHLIHKEDWHIQVRAGVPWFIPPPHTDPHRTPRRNHYFQI